jgi:hypothetical protein
MEVIRTRVDGGVEGDEEGVLLRRVVVGAGERHFDTSLGSFDGWSGCSGYEAEISSQSGQESGESLHCG